MENKKKSQSKEQCNAHIQTLRQAYLTCSNLNQHIGSNLKLHSGSTRSRQVHSCHCNSTNEPMNQSNLAAHPCNTTFISYGCYLRGWKMSQVMKKDVCPALRWRSSRAGRPSGIWTHVTPRAKKSESLVITGQLILRAMAVAQRSASKGHTA